jgi:tetratricopeptide (TPR) repeat protein
MKIPFFKKKDPRAEFEKKLARCRREAEASPNDMRLMTKIAEMYLENGNTAEAIKEYLNVAKGYQGIHKNSIVVGIFRHILQLDPSQIDVYHLLVDELMKDVLMGDAVEVMVKLATYYYGRDLHYEAAQAIKKIKTIDPNNKFYSSKVEKFFRDRNLDPNALEQIGPKSKWTLIAQPRRQADELSDEEPEGGFFNLQEVLGESTLSGFISSMPGDTAQNQSAGHVEPNSVFDQLKEFIDTDKKSDSPEFHYNLAMAYLRNNDYEKAHDEFLTALYGIADKLDCYKQLIGCCSELRWLDLAREYIGKAQKLPKLDDRERLWLDYTLGLVCKDSGDRKKALQIFKKIAQKDINFKSVAHEIKELEQEH